MTILLSCCFTQNEFFRLNLYTLVGLVEFLFDIYGLSFTTNKGSVGIPLNQFLP